MGAAGLALLALSIAGCGGREKSYEITDVRDRPDAGPAAPFQSAGTRFGADRGEGDGADARPSWSATTPAGWEQAPSAPMRDLAWRIAGHTDAEVTFSALPGGAGGLAANVNRWRKQMGLGPLEDAALAALPKRSLMGRPATYVELAGDFQGMGGRGAVKGAKLLGLVVELPMATAFLKMTGPAAVVDAEAAKFLAVAESVRMGGASTGPTAPTAPAATSPPPDTESAPLRWTAPAGWKEQPPKTMRVVSFVPEGLKRTEAYVTILGGAAGGARANVDRWRSQMGLEAMTDTEFGALPRKQVLGAEAVFVAIEGSFAGMDPGQAKAGWMLLGMILTRGDQSVFAKMTGPADEVRPERARFEAFCESLHDR